MDTRKCMALLLGLMLGSFWAEAQLNLIPQPAMLAKQKGTFALGASTPIFYADEPTRNLAIYAAELFQQGSGLVFEPVHGDTQQAPSGIVLQLLEAFDQELAQEGYLLDIQQEGVVLRANTPAGLFYGIQSLRLLLLSNTSGQLEAVSIRDYPRFGYRGLHLDVSRHFMPVAFIYKMLDQMAMHKLNVFHWHLIDDQGWRLQIRKYPKLTEVGAWRVDRSDLHWNDRPLMPGATEAHYGGYYTQDEVRAIVAYAQKLNITVMPEIELPAHVMSALAAYPELSCTGENLGVPTGGVWPITHIYCAGQESTFHFLEDVLREVMELFPSSLIHIGGDEADKTNWKACPRCQERIRAEGLQDEHELQSYFIRRIEKFLSSHGRTLVGWDEILEGGLAPGAVVMSWRGEKGGIEAAQMGHKVIMTPDSHVYFDHYQGEPSLEPLAIGGFSPLKKVYHYEPIPAVLSPEQALLVMGAQANVWTEYMPTTAQVEYMVFPRLAALSEVLWSPAALRDWADFCRRMEDQYLRYDKLDIGYALSAFQVSDKARVLPGSKTLEITLDAQIHQPQIVFTLDGSDPQADSEVYQRPVLLRRSAVLKAAVRVGDRVMDQVTMREYDLHKAFGARVRQENPVSVRYNGGGSMGLVDGIRGTSNHNDGNWSGFLGHDMVAVVDLGQKTQIRRISVDALQNYGAWIFFPAAVTFEVSSDGRRYRTLEHIPNQVSVEARGALLQEFTSQEPAQGIRYVRVRMHNIGQCPEGHAGAGKAAWLFSSEIKID